MLTIGRQPQHAVALGAALLAAVACSPSPRSVPAPAAALPAPVTSARQLVERMRQHHDGKWYRTLTFLQNNTLYKQGGGEERSQWMEYQAVPRRLRIEFLPASSKSGIIFANDTVHTFQNGEKVRTVRQIHPLLLLSADLYALPADTTIAALDSLGFDLGVLRRDSLDGRAVYVAGAAPGDSASSQFWVDAERMLLVRLLHGQSAAGRRVVTDYRFTYQDVGGYPVPREILFARDGRPFWREEYTDVKVDVELSPLLFDPARWSETAEGLRE